MKKTYFFWKHLWYFIGFSRLASSTGWPHRTRSNEILCAASATDLLDGPSGRKRQSCDVPLDRDQWLSWAASLHLTWWTDWVTGHPGTHDDKQADKPADTRAINVWYDHGDKLMLYTDRVVVFVLQIPSVDGTFGWGVWRLWPGWNFHRFPFNLTDSAAPVSTQIHCTIVSMMCKLW